MDMELRDFFRMIQRKIGLITAIVLIGLLIMGIVSVYVLKPKFEASSTIIVNNQTAEQQGGTPALDVNTSILLANTYKEIVLNPSLLNKVLLEYPELELTREQLAESLKVTNISQTPVMTITATDTDFSRAVNIVNAVSNVFKAELPKMLQVDNVTILNQASLEDKPKVTTPHPVIQLTIAFVVLVMFAVGFISLLEHLDETIKDDKDAEKVLGIPNLATIPKIHKVKRAKRNDTKVYSKSVGEPIHEGISQ
ncbi:YveK family protein [Paenibacillus senegalensis]|uniref:YveK family protein n=1 Tax=Paenibacillus senegalensis TaxID=1465766 RepID=UPI000288BA73|nr:Wzz/FepE/Etk N-terminal domain-containing protein [Paenibacillus senegalensis]